MIPRIAIPQAHSGSPEYRARVMPQYFEAVRRVGGEAVEIALDLDNHQIARLAASCDAVLLPGSRADVNPEKYGAARGPHTADDDPLRDNADELLLQDAYNMRKPILGICFGLQSLNVWRTGTLQQHISGNVQHAGNGKEKAPTHWVKVEGTSKLAELMRAGLGKADPDAEFIEIMVNSSHHQAALLPGDGLRPVAWSAEDDVIEALEGTSSDHWVMGVQWHPERMLEEGTALALFLAFVEAARRRHLHPRAPSIPT